MPKIAVRPNAFSLTVGDGDSFTVVLGIARPLDFHHKCTVIPALGSNLSRGYFARSIRVALKKVPSRLRLELAVESRENFDIRLKRLKFSGFLKGPRS